MTEDNEERLLRSVALQNAESIRIARDRAEKQAEATLWEQANLLNLTHDSIFVRDMNDIITYWNHGAEELYGWKMEEAIGQVSHQLTRTIFPGVLERITEELLATDRWEGELVHTKRDGTQVVVASRWSLQRDERGKPIAILETNNDITERRQAEEAARRSEKDLRGVIETIPAIVWSTLPDGGVDFINQRWQEFTGLSPEDALAWSWESVVHPDDHSRFVADWRAALKHGQPMESEVRVRRADGKYRWLLVRNVPLRDELENIVKWYGTGVDIEARKRAEEKLHAAMSERTRLAAFREEIGIVLAREENLRGILHGCTEVMVRHLDAAFARIWMLGSDGRELELQASAGMYTRLDGSHSRIPVGQLKIGLIAQERKPHLTNDVQNDPRVDDKNWARRESMISFAGYPLLMEDRVLGVLGMFSQKPLTEGTLEALSAVADSIAQGIERKRAEEALRRSEAHLAEAQRLTHTGSWAWDRVADRMIYWSEELFRIYGFNPQAGIPSPEKFRQRVHPEDHDKVYERIQNAVNQKVDYVVDHRIMLPDGTVKYIQTVGRPIVNTTGDIIEYIGTAVDGTERKRAEEELRKAQAELAHVTRVTSMGELTSSIAHEVNQPLAAIVANGSACLRWLMADSPNLEEARETARRVIRDGKRASDIIGRIRALVRKTDLEKARLDINETIQEIILLAQNETGGKGMVLRMELAADPPQVLGDRVQLQQVILNLVLNGVEAMATVADRPRELLVYSRGHGSDQVLVAVRDSGVGIDKQNLEKIFDPFYTTKSHGIGMGLAISRSIVENHGGKLWAVPNDGPGATFQFTLLQYV